MTQTAIRDDLGAGGGTSGFTRVAHGGEDA